MGNIKDFDDNSNLKLFPSPALKSLFDNLNAISRPQNPDEPSSINCEYYEADQKKYVFFIPYEYSVFRPA